MVSVGGGFVCALTRAGAVRCWGDNSRGQLGDGTTTDRSTPGEVVGLGSGVRSITAGGSHACALTVAGAVRCWGNNDHGQLGDGTTTDRPAPVEVAGLGSGVRSLAAGYGSTCVVDGNRAAKCWGDNHDGQLGDGTSRERWKPVPVVGGSGLRSVAVGYNHACALSVAASVACWGWMSGMTAGGAGDGSTTLSATPVPVKDMWAEVRSVAVGSAFSCVLTIGGGVKCWGNNDHGELGIHEFSDRETPEDVVGLGSGLAAVATGYVHACAVTTVGTVTCWGWNRSGQLGDGTAVDRFKPVPVMGLKSRIQSVSAGESETCAMGFTGTVECWGRNDHGQLGDGTTTDRMTPLAVTLDG